MSEPRCSMSPENFFKSFCVLSNAFDKSLNAVVFCSPLFDSCSIWSFKSTISFSSFFTSFTELPVSTFAVNIASFLAIYFLLLKSLTFLFKFFNSFSIFKNSSSSTLICDSNSFLIYSIFFDCVA